MLPPQPRPAPAEFAAPATVADAGRAEQADVLAFEPAGASAAAEDAYVIDVELTPEAAGQQAFEQLLIRNQLSELPSDWTGEPDAAARLGDDLAAEAKTGSVEGAAKPADVAEKAADESSKLQDGQQKPAFAKRAQAGGGEAEQDRTGRGLLGRSQTNRREADRNAAKDTAAEEAGENALAQDMAGETAEVFEFTVAATPEQFVATLHDLRQHPEQFANSSVRYAQAPAVAQYRALEGGAAIPAPAEPADALNGGAHAVGRCTGAGCGQEAGRRRSCKKSSSHEARSLKASKLEARREASRCEASTRHRRQRAGRHRGDRRQSEEPGEIGASPGAGRRGASGPAQGRPVGAGSTHPHSRAHSGARDQFAGQSLGINESGSGRWFRPATSQPAGDRAAQLESREG